MCSVALVAQVVLACASQRRFIPSAGREKSHGSIHFIDLSVTSSPKHSISKYSESDAPVNHPVAFRNIWRRLRDWRRGIVLRRSSHASICAQGFFHRTAGLDIEQHIGDTELAQYTLSDHLIGLCAGQ